MHRLREADFGCPKSVFLRRGIADLRELQGKANDAEYMGRSQLNKQCAYVRFVGPAS